MSEMKPCPFCGEQVFTPLVSSLDDGYTRCISCGAKMQHRRWQTRPIEDELRKRIAELEALVERLIEAGDGMKSFLTPYVDGFRDSYPATSAWDALVEDWKERER